MSLTAEEREKRGEAEPEDLSGNLTVQLGKVTEDLNRRWFEVVLGLERKPQGLGQAEAVERSRCHL